jgi:LysM repeat protein
MKPHPSARSWSILTAWLLYATVSLAQTEMTRQEVQQEIDRYTRLRDERRALLLQLTNDAEASEKRASKLEEEKEKCMDDLYSLVGSDAAQAATFRAGLEIAEQQLGGLTRLSTTELQARKSDVEALGEKVTSSRATKLALIPEFWGRLLALDQSITMLKNSLAPPHAADYVVQENDCLWTIAQKPSVYNDGSAWPKIWQANRIANPDIIHPGMVLTIPHSSELTPDEQKGMNAYYHKKKGSRK